MTRPAPSARLARLDPRVVDAAVLVGLLVLAAALRLPDLATRGPWDADQGEQMLVIRGLVNGGQLPLLGPPTSQQSIHHGPVFYYIGALFALPSGGNDPTAVTLGIVLGGIATVGLTWWLVRAAGGGRVAAAVTALLVAVAAHMIDASVRLWNPAFVAPGAALALAAAFEGRRRDDPRWWALAAIGLVLAAQSHLLGWVLIVPLGVLALAELRRIGGRAIPSLAVAAAIVAASFLPLIAHELATGLAELRALIDGGAAAGADNGPSLLLRVFFVPLRILAVPLVRDVVAAVAVTTAAAALVVGAAALASTRASRASSSARVLAAGLAAGIAIIVVSTSWLATVTPLYVDHYPLALAPSIFALLGLGAATLGKRSAGRTLVAAVTGVIVAWNLVVVRLPPVHADGGWPAGLAAAQRVVNANEGASIVVLGVPEFKRTTALDYPLVVLGHEPVQASEATHVAVLCDALFEEVVGLDCRGPAEFARMAELEIPEGALVDRFEAAPGRWISVYRVAGR